VKKEQNGRESLRRLKPAVGCNTSKRRSSSYNDFMVKGLKIENEI
jgi:hypothetical protein